MGRSPCCSHGTVNKGHWLPEESERLIEYVQKNGPRNWQTLPKRAGLNRCGKSCRLRWNNYLRPGIKKEPFSEEEEAKIISLHQELGNKWSRIAAKLPGRTDNAIKNYWNTRLKKKFTIKSGIDPKTHDQQISEQILSSSNLFNLIPPLNPAFNFQFLQELKNVLQPIHWSLLPYRQVISQLCGLINGASTQYIDGNFFQPQNILAGLGNLSSTSNSLQCWEREFNTQGVPDYNTRTCTNINTSDSEYSLPSLVSEIPESSIVNPLENINSYVPTQVFESDIFDTLDNFLEDEGNISFLKDILG